jgi:hypothetical protein
MDKNSIVIGVDYNEKELVIGFINFQGMFKGASSGQSPLPAMFRKEFEGIVRGLRGDENLRMKNFVAISIAVSDIYARDEVFSSIKRQVREFLDIPIFVEPKNKIVGIGEKWLQNLENVNDPRRNALNRDFWNLAPVYGAAKLAVDNMLSGNYPYDEQKEG